MVPTCFRKSTLLERGSLQPKRLPGESLRNDGIENRGRGSTKGGKAIGRRLLPWTCSLALGDGGTDGDITGADRPDFPAGWECSNQDRRLQKDRIQGGTGTEGWTLVHVAMAVGQMSAACMCP